MIMTLQFYNFTSEFSTMVVLQRISHTNIIYHCQRTLGKLNIRLPCIRFQQKPPPAQQERPLWGYVAIAFNTVDSDRLSKVGPDRLCAEWLLKNGGGVGLVGMPRSKILKDYNTLPAENVKFKVQTVDASNSSIMKIGLDHFIGCQHIDTVIFHNCKHLEDGGLDGLVHLKDTLKELQVSGCYNLQDSCLDVIAKLAALEELRLSDLIYVKDMQGIATKLRKALPNCKVVVN